MPTEQTPQQLRSFGLLVGAGFTVIGLWPTVYRGEMFRVWALLLAGGLGFFALRRPTALRFVYRGWIWLGHILGWINTRILLGLVFYILFAPIGFLLRMSKRDPLPRALDRQAQTYRVVRQPRNIEHMKRQF
jgi:hypothetical protein